MLLLILTVLSVTFLVAPLGCVLLWQRYNYLSDGLIHACLFANVVSYFFGTTQIISMMAVAVIFSTLVFILRNYSDKNAVIDLVKATLLSSAIIFSSYFQERTVFETMMFGDILSIDWSTLYIILGLILVLGVFLLRFMKAIVIISLDTNVAYSKRLPVSAIEYGILMIMGLVIAISIKLLGAFLVGSLLIIPAMAGKLVSKSPVSMILKSAFIGVISGISGLYISFFWDWPLSPSISVSAVSMYLLLLVGRRII